MKAQLAVIAVIGLFVIDGYARDGHGRGGGGGRGHVAKAVAVKHHGGGHQYRQLQRHEIRQDRREDRRDYYDDQTSVYYPYGYYPNAYYPYDSNQNYPNIYFVCYTVDQQNESGYHVACPSRTKWYSTSPKYETPAYRANYRPESVCPSIGAPNYYEFNTINEADDWSRKTCDQWLPYQ